MNIDEAMAIGRKEKPDWYFNANEAAPILAAEVERLREANQLLHAKVSSAGAENERLQTELAEAGDGDTWRDACARVEAELAKTRSELAAAKAASVVPVKWKSVERFFKSGADLGNQWGIEFWFDTKEQRDKFCKWMKERGEG